jgi:anhydro-N-acetylmuramic acid kinase
MGSSSEIYIGLMSGTSLDGVDIAIVDYSKPIPAPLYCNTQSYPPKFQQRLRELIRADKITIDELCRLDIEVSRFYAEVVQQALSTAAIVPQSIKAIGCHGQTICHSPDIEPTYTLQIGDPNTLSARTGITTVADFRRRDMALGGQGAPLAPAFHQTRFRSDRNNRAIINIGGIANVTYLPANQNETVIGFDTGPGNTLLDYWINLQQGLKQDNNGDWAAAGQINSELLETMLFGEDYFRRAPPKSTGTEYFCPAWLHAFSPENYAAIDIQATLLELTARTIASGISQLPETPVECFVCGGGVHNHYLMKRLQHLLNDSEISSTAKLAVDPDYVEAQAFAWLARETTNQRPGNLPSVTHARSSVVLGGIFHGE